ncbi:MAG: CAP domain-containing protein, partial [Myxococcota bacterium]
MTPLLLALLTATPTDAALLKAVQARFEAAGRQTPPADPALDRAARQIARHALGAGVTDAAGLLRVTAAISDAGGWDPNPVAVLVRASADELIPTVARQLSIDEPVTALGIAVVMEGERGAAVTLLVKRRMQLSPFARSHPAPPRAAQRLCGKLLSPLSAADVFVTRPSGEVDSAPMTPSAQGLCASLT